MISLTHLDRADGILLSGDYRLRITADVLVFIFGFWCSNYTEAGSTNTQARGPNEGVGIQNK
jgi:hypothetical protein